MSRQQPQDDLSEFFSSYLRRPDPHERAAEEMQLAINERNKKLQLAENKHSKTKRTVLLTVALCAAVLLAAGAYAAVALYGYNSFSDKALLTAVTGGGDSLTPAYVSRLFSCGVDRFVCEREGVERVAYIEASSSAVTVTGADFRKPGSSAEVGLICEESTFVPSETGIRKAQLTVAGRTVPAVIEVRDTIPPSGRALEGAEYWICDPIAPEHFVIGVSDATGVSYSFVDLPEHMEAGDTLFTVRLTDEAGNYTDINCPVAVFRDTEAPQIIGAEDRTVALGSTVAYKEGVYVSDNHCEDIELKVDISDVVADVEGVYEVVFSATDASGNSCVKSVSFTFAKSRDALIDEDLRSRVSAILDSIITPGMTQREKAKAIYDWIRWHISYISYADKSSWKLSALNALKTRTGSCYSYYALSRAMLDAVGIPNMMVQRAGHKSEHYWNLINCGDGWYHFDTTPRVSGGYFFMWTDEKILDYSKKHKGSHDFDRSLYPATPLE